MKEIIQIFMITLLIAIVGQYCIEANFEDCSIQSRNSVTLS